MVAKEDRLRKRLEWEVGISRCKLLYIGWINSKVLLYNAKNYSQYLVINHNRNGYEKECIYMYKLNFWLYT